MLDLGVYNAERFQNLDDLFHGAVDGVIDHLVFVLVRAGQFASGHFEPPLDRLFRFGTAGPQAALQLGLGAGPQKYGGHVGKLAADLFRPININI